MDASLFYAYGFWAVVGGYVGVLVAEHRRERQHRREIAANLVRAVDRVDAGPHPDANPSGHINANGFPRPDDHGGTGPHGDGHGDFLTVTVNPSDRYARRRAVSRANVGPRPVSGLPLGAARIKHASAVGAGYDCG